MLGTLWTLGLVLVFSMGVAGCYHKKTPSTFHLPDSVQEAQISKRILSGNDLLTNKQENDHIEWHGSANRVDSFAFRVKHHYSQGFNFVVRADSLMLIRQQPEEAVNNLATDSFAVKKGKSLVVADIRIIPNDSIDSVWVQIATENFALRLDKGRAVVEES